MRVRDAVVLALATVLSAAAIAVYPAQFYPVLFRYDTEFIGVALSILVLGGAYVAWRVGVRGGGRVPVSPPLAVAALGAALGIGGVIGYRFYDGIGWPRPVYLVVVILPAILAWTALASGRRAARWHRLVTAALTLPIVLAAAVIHGGISLALSGDPDGRANHCVVRGNVEYCHFSGYRPFVDFWEPVVSAVLDASPPSPERLRVQQTREGVRPARAGVAPLLEWGRGDTAPLALALDAAAWRTRAVPVRGRDTRPSYYLERQGARAMVIFWLAAQATEKTRNGFKFFVTKDACGDAVGGNSYVQVPVPSDGALHAAALLKDADAGEKVRAHWSTLTDARTTLNEAATLLDIEPVVDVRPRC